MTQSEAQKTDEAGLAAALQSAREQQAAVSDVLRVTSRSSTDIEGVFDVVVEHALKLCRGDFSYLYRRDGEVFRIVASRGGSAELLAYEQANPTPITHRTLIGRVALTKAVVHIPDQFEDPEYDWPANREHGVHTLLGVPAMRDQEVVAVIGVARNERRPFSADEIRLVEIFADQAAIAIENVRLFKQTNEALERQTAVGEVLRTMASSPADRQLVLDAIARNAARFCAAEDCGVALVRSDGLLEQVAHFGPISQPLPPWPVDRGSVRGRAIVERRIVHVEDMLAESEQEYPTGVRRAREVGQRTVLAAPLLREGVALGAIALRRTEVNPFTEKQIDLLRTFADQAAIAIENVRLFNETKEALAQQTALSEVLNTISHSVFDLDAVLQTIVERAAALCDADNASISRRVGDVAIVAAAFGELLSGRTPPGTSLAIDDRTLIGRAMHTRERQYVPDARREPDLPQSGPQTRLVIPFVRDGIAIGTLGVGRRVARPFSAAELRLFDVFADQAAIAIENVRLFNETKEALERQTALSDILRVIAESPGDRQPVLDAIARNTTLYCGAEDAVVLLVQGNEVAPLAHHGPIRTPRGNNPIVRTGVAGRAILERRTIHVADLAGPAGEEFPLARQRSEEGDRHRGILAAPLLREGAAIGAILLRKLEPTGFTSNEIKLVEAFADQAVIAIENVRLFNETKDALERQTAISEILRAIARSPGDEKPVLATIAYSATTFCGAEDASILLIRDGKFGFAAHHGPVLLGSGSFSIPMTRESVAGHAVIERRTVQVGDVLGPEGDAYPPAKEGFAETGQRAILATPLLREDQPIGAIVLRRTEPGAFSANQVSLVEAFADQAVIAIENVRLFNETKEALERQTSISEVLETIGRSAFDLQPVLDTVVERAARLCEADYGSISTLDGDVYRTRAYWGASTVPQDYIELMRTEARRPGRGTLTGRTALEGRVIHIHDVLADPDYTASDMQQAGGYRTLLGVPLLRDGEVIGVFALCRNDVKPFTERQIDLVRTFGDQAAIAIENVRLFNETKESLERQTALAEILRVIADSPSDRQPVLDAVARSTTRYCGAEDAVIFLVDGNELRRVAHHGPIPIRNETAPLDERGVAPHAVLTRRTIHVADIESPAGDRYPLTRAFAAESGRRGSLAAPLLREGTPIGVILLRKMEPTGFTASQIQLVEAFADQAMIALENVRLFNETKEALEQQTAVGDVLKTISRSAFDLQPVLDIVLNNAVRLAGADIGWLSRVENDQFMTVAYSTEFPQSVRDELARQRAQGHLSGPWVPLGTGGGLMGFTLAEGRTVHLKDVKEDPDLKGSVVARLTDSRTVVGVPMLREGRSIGGMVLARYDVRPFDARELELVQTFADQAAIAIENVRLFNETSEALERQTAVAQVLGEISQSGFELRPVLETAIEHATKLCAAQQGFIYRREGDAFRLVVAHDITPEFKAFTEANPINPMGRGTVTGRVVEDRVTVHIPDVLNDPEYTYWEAQKLGNFRAILGVPMMRDDEVIGVMLLWRTEPQPFSEQEIALVTTFANQATIAIENVRLFDETKEALEQQSAISDVLKTISGTVFELAPTLQTVVENAGKLADADLAWMTQRSDQDTFTWAARYARTPELGLAFGDLSGLRPGPGTGQSLMSRLYGERRTITVSDVEADPDLLSKSRIAKLVGARSVVGVPVLSEGDVLGAIVLARREVRPFSEREVHVVETFADQAAIAIRNVRLFNEIQNKSRQLEVASRHKSEFLANMSHELRTPLNAIIGFSEVLIQGLFGDVNEKQREYLQDVIGSGQHLLSLINDILDLSKIEAGRVELELSTFSLRDALNSGLTIVRERANRHSIAINAVVADDLGQLEADERKVKQIFYNLLSNAVKFTADGGRVDVIARRENGDARVEVRDSGIGIAEEDQARIFEEFQQVGRERSREGTGLGLTLTKRFVELHGGHISLQSAPGKGSTFTFTLPLRQPGPVPA